MKAVIRVVVVAFCALAPHAAHAGEQAERDAIYAAAKDAFLASRFSELEETAEDYRLGKSTTSSGARRLSVFYDTFESLKFLYGNNDLAARDRFTAQLEAWLSASSRSKPANILIARDLISRAWLARGSGYANSVSEAQWEAFRGYIGKAKNQIERIRDFARGDPEWYATALVVARDSGEPRSAFDRLADEALAVDGYYGRVRQEILINNQAKWGGSPASYDDAVEKIVAATAKEQGLSTYARSYLYSADLSRNGFIFQKTLAKWPRMKAAFEDMLARYPTDWNLNLYGSVACAAHDDETLKAILDKLGERADPSLWFITTLASCVAKLERKRIEAEDKAFYSKPIPVAEESAERARIESEATTALLDGRFDDIEAVRAKLLQDKARTASGAWKLMFYTEGLTPSRLLLPGSEATAEKIRARISEWRTARPASIPAAVAMARLFMTDALLVRGLRAKQIDVGEGVSEIAKFVDKARRELDSSRAVAGHDLAWSSTLLLVDGIDLVTDEAFAADAARALAIEPTYDETLTTILARPNLRSASAVEDYGKAVGFVMKPLPAERLDEAYADSFLRLGERWGGDTIVSDMKLDWPRMRRGLDAIVTRWPTDWNLTAYARFACMAKDKATASALLDRLGERIVWIQWTNWRAHGQCRSWASAQQ